MRSQRSGLPQGLPCPRAAIRDPRSQSSQSSPHHRPTTETPQPPLKPTEYPQDARTPPNDQLPTKHPTSPRNAPQPRITQRPLQENLEGVSNDYKAESNARETITNPVNTRRIQTVISLHSKQGIAPVHYRETLEFTNRSIQHDLIPGENS